MTVLITLLSFLLGDADVERFRATAPTYLTTESAREHLSTAMAAAVVTDEDPYVFLAIALGESTYKANVVKVEVSGTLSCGVIQATAPNWSACNRMRASLWEGYYAGALLFRSWRTNPRCAGSTACALAGYAGGWRALDFCRANPRSVACWKAVTNRLNLSDMIRGQRTRDAKKTTRSSS